jgi:hypothetical protein
MKRTREPYVIGIRIELHNVCLHQIGGEEMFIQEQERVFSFWFIILVDGDVLKLFGVERQGICWENGKWLNEDDIM